MSFISPSLVCVALGVDVQHIRYLDPPFQFRGFFYSTDADVTCFAKGMFKIDWTLSDSTVILTSSCVKARRPGFCDDLLYGVDVTKVFNCVFNEPTVNGDVLNSLNLRVCAVREVGARARALSLYNKFAQECKDHAQNTMVHRAFRLPMTEHPVSSTGLATSMPRSNGISAEKIRHGKHDARTALSTPLRLSRLRSEASSLICALARSP